MCLALCLISYIPSSSVSLSLLLLQGHRRIHSTAANAEETNSQFQYEGVLIGETQVYDK